MKSSASLVAALCLTACAHAGDGTHEQAIGWSVDDTASPGLEQRGLMRFVISGRPDAVDEFAREAVADGWVTEARAVASADLVFVQFLAPYRPERTSSFIDRYLLESPRRLNIGHIISDAEISE